MFNWTFHLDCKSCETNGEMLRDLTRAVAAIARKLSESAMTPEDIEALKRQLTGVAEKLEAVAK